jgi:hypothetical protein
MEVAFKVFLPKIGIQTAVDNGVIPNDRLEVILVKSIIIYLGVAIHNTLLDLHGKGRDGLLVKDNAILSALLVMAGSNEEQQGAGYENVSDGSHGFP